MYKNAGRFYHNHPSLVKPGRLLEPEKIVSLGEKPRQPTPTPAGASLKKIKRRLVKSMAYLTSRMLAERTRHF